MKLGGACEGRDLRVEDDALRYRILGDLARRARDGLLDFPAEPACLSAPIASIAAAPDRCGHCRHCSEPSAVTVRPPLVLVHRHSTPANPP